MPPVGAAIGAAFTAIGASVSAALTGTAISGFALKAFTQIAIGVALSAISRMLTPRPKIATQGVRTSVNFGEDAPATILLGRYATAGDLVYAGSYGDDNEIYVLVLELGDLPARLRRVMVNGEWINLSATEGERGKAVPEYRRKGDDFLWIKFFNGTQTSPSAYLRDKFGDDPVRPWEADMVGRGIPYAIVSARFSTKVHRGVPEVLFELDGARLYDPRRDSSVGGSGAQRRGDPSTWSGFGDPANENPVVQIYNIMLGLRDPVTDVHLWGGTDIDQRDLAVSAWFAAMNECDAHASGAEGVEPQYRAGIEITLEDETEPADVIDELLNACQGQLAEAAGAWVVRAGPPGAAVFAFTDDDVIVTSPEELDPFPGLDQVYNGVSARYPEPEDGWADKEAPLRLNATYRAEDGGRLRVAQLAFPTVPCKSQVQRLMASALKDQRRFRRHTVVLPPEARALGPLDVVEWKSERHGYEDKQFTVDLVEDLPSGCVALALREIDPSDYDFGDGDLLPTTTGFLGRPPRLPQPTDFGAEGVSLPDGGGTARRPGIKLDWNPSRKADGVRYQLQLLDRPEDLPLLGGHDYSDDDLTPDHLDVFEGEPLEAFEDEPLISAFVSDLLQGTAIITAGILPACAYRIRARYVPNGEWCDWIPVTTPDTRISTADLDAALNTRIDDAQSAADGAASDAANALATANAALEQVGILAGDTIADLEALLADLGGIDAGDLTANRLLALRALQSGWNTDPTFQLWTAGSPDKWTATGLGSEGVQFEGYYGGGLALDIPSGAIAVTLTASSSVAGQMPAGDADAPWLVLYALVTFTGGNADALRLRVEWLPDGGSTWAAGDMKGLTAPVGSFTQLGISAKPGQMQGVEVLVKRPAGLASGADGVRLVLQKSSSITTAIDCDFHLVGLRKASEAEIAAGQAAGALSAAISTLTTTITGVSDALAALQTSLATTAPGGVTALLSSTYLTAANTTSAIAAAEASLQTNINGVSTNLATHYYTRSQVDSGINTAVGGLSTELGGRIEDTEIAISDETGFRVAGDNALGGRISTLEARSDPGSIVTNGSFATGELTGWAGGLAGQAVHANFTVVAKGGTVSAQQQCPTAFMLKIAVDAGTTRTIFNELCEAKAGDTISLSALCAAGGTTRDITLRFIVRWRDLNGAVVGSSFTEVANYTGTAWTRVQTPSYVAPANTAKVGIEIQRIAGGSGDAYVTGIEARKGDTGALARIAATETVATNASNAIASLSTAINATFGSQAAFLSETSTAVASLDLLASTYVLRQRAGAAVGHVEAVAFSTPDGTALSTFQLDYDYIDLEGRVSARDLVISSSVNLVPDDQLQVESIWIQSAVEWQLFPNTNVANAQSIGEVRYIGTASTGAAVSTGKKFPVTVGETLACSFRCRGNGSQYRAYAQLQFFDVDGVPIATPSTVSFGVTLTTSAVTVVPAPEVVVVPTGAFQACWRWVVDRTQTTSAYVRFFGPTVRRQAGAIEIADGAITAPKINVTDLGAIVATLGTCTITSALKFAPGVVVTGAIGLNAVTDVGAGLRTSVLTLTLEDTWYDICSFTVNVVADAAVLLSSRVEFSQTPEWNISLATTYKASGIVTYRVLRGTTVVHVGLREMFIDASPGTGNKTYKLQAMSIEPGDGEFTFNDSSGNPYDVAWHPTTKSQSAKIDYGHMLVQCFKR